MRIKYLHAFSLDRCQFPSGGAAAPLDHARFVAAAPQGYTYPAQPLESILQYFDIGTGDCSEVYVVAFLCEFRIMVGV